MQIRQGKRYGQIARIFHWLTAVFVIAAFTAGVTMLKIGSGQLQNQLFDLHRSLGFSVLVLVVLRLVWRLTHLAPPLGPEIGSLQRFAAEVMHWLLYGLILVQPILGWLGSNAFGAPIHVYGLFDLPIVMPKDEVLAKILFGAHQFVGYAIFAFVTLHVLAAGYHMARRDGVMSRMWW
jgi:cytochrome b561